MDAIHVIDHILRAIMLIDSLLAITLNM